MIDYYTCYATCIYASWKYLTNFFVRRGLGSFQVMVIHGKLHIFAPLVHLILLGAFRLDQFLQCFELYFLLVQFNGIYFLSWIKNILVPELCKRQLVRYRYLKWLRTICVFFLLTKHLNCVKVSFLLNLEGLNVCLQYLTEQWAASVTYFNCKATDNCCTRWIYCFSFKIFIQLICCKE